MYLGGSKDKLKVRLHLQKIPEDIAQKRLKKYESREKNQSKNRKIPYRNSDFKKELAQYNVFITNAPHELLKTSQISPFYRLRWQIEPGGRPRSF